MSSQSFSSNTPSTESVLNSIYTTSRASNPKDGEIALINVDPDELPKPGELSEVDEKMRLEFISQYPVSARAQITQQDTFTLNHLPMNTGDALKANDVFSKFSNIRMRFRSNARASILPQLTNNLPGTYKTPEGKLDSLPIDNKTNDGRDEHSYRWRTLDFPTEIEVCCDALSEGTRALPGYDDQSAREDLKRILGGWNVVPAVSDLSITARTA